MKNVNEMESYQVKKGGKKLSREKQEGVCQIQRTEAQRWRDREVGGEAGKGIRNQPVHCLVGPFKDLGLYPETNGKPLQDFKQENTAIDVQFLQSSFWLRHEQFGGSYSYGKDFLGLLFQQSK